MFNIKRFSPVQGNSNEAEVGRANESYIALDELGNSKNGSNETNGSRTPRSIARIKSHMLEDGVVNQAKVKAGLSRNTDLDDKYCTKRREYGSTVNKYRVGPQPLDECQKDGRIVSQSSVAMLDGDLGEEEVYGFNANGKSIPGSRGLFIYFERLSTSKDETETVDLKFVESLLSAGADINFTDRYGQCILHAIVKDWHPDIAKFVIERGADINQADKYGRTPLHVAVAVDYPEMIEYLISLKANIEAKTKGEEQTPAHYAAKNNAIASLKTLVASGADINQRDYRGRTPCFVAAELGRSDATEYLLDVGVAAGVFDRDGSSAASVMVAKVPSLAPRALQQFYHTDKALRKSYYYLAQLERGSSKSQVRLANPKSKTTLEVIVFYSELGLITHPVIKKMIAVKWNLFGRKHVVASLLINLIYTLLWTSLGFAYPRDGAFYSPLPQKSWRITLELLVFLVTFYFMAVQFLEARNDQLANKRWLEWRCQVIERDLVYSHPRWPDERRFLTSELQQLNKYSVNYFRNGWNVLEFIALLSVFLSVATRIAYVASPTDSNHNVHRIAFSLTLILVWLRLMRICQGFAFLSAFVTLLGHVITDTIKFAFLFFEFFIPYVCAFWIMFGGAENAQKMKAAGQDSEAYLNMNNLIYTMWTMTLVGDFDLKSLEAIDETLAHVFTATYFALVSIVCLNLYIALMSETFSRVYGNAQANAYLQQAKLMLTIEKGLNNNEQKKIKHFLRTQCSPLEEYDDGQEESLGTSQDALVVGMQELQVSTNETKSSVKDLVSVMRNEKKSGKIHVVAKKLNEVANVIASLKESQEEMMQQQTQIIQALNNAGIKLDNKDGEKGIKGMLNFMPKFLSVETAKPKPEETMKRSKSENSISTLQDANTSVDYTSSEETEKKTKKKRRGRSKQR